MNGNIKTSILYTHGSMFTDFNRCFYRPTLAVPLVSMCTERYDSFQNVQYSYIFKLFACATFQQGIKEQMFAVCLFLNVSFT